MRHIQSPQGLRLTPLAPAESAPMGGDLPRASVATDAFWLESGSGRLACWMHLPDGSHRRGPVVVLCAPIGFEYSHSHRSLRHLAMALSSAGTPCIRFDYRGTGDSSGDVLGSGVLADWVHDVQTVARFAASMTSPESVSLVGLRLGATLAGLASAELPVQRLAMWAPVVSGRRHVRELRAAAGTSAAPKADDPASDFFDSGGFVVSADLSAGLSKIDLKSVELPEDVALLLVAREDLKGDGGLASSLGDRGISFESLQPGGFGGMMAEPQETSIPGDAIHAIVEWMSGGDARGWAPENPSPEPPPSFASVRAPAGTAVTERFVWIGDAHPLFGVLTEVEGNERSRSPLIVLANAGAVHHAGPNRLYTEMARGLADAGLASLRIDIRNLGESVIPGTSEENHPYPSTAVADLSSAVDWASGDMGFQRVVVVGLCSGAHHAFHAARELEQDCLAGVVLINPLTFYWIPGMTLDMPSGTAGDAAQYRQSVRDPSKWLKAIRGQADLPHLMRFVRRRLTERLQRSTSNLLEALRVRPPRPLAVDLAAIVEQRRKVAFFFSLGDPGFDLLQHGARRTVGSLERRGLITIDFVDGADHTFSRRLQREEVIARVCGKLARW